MQNLSFGRREITTLASIVLFTGFLFGWVSVADLQKREVQQTQVVSAGISRTITRDRATVGSGRIMISNNGSGLYVINADPSDQQNSYTVAPGFFQNTNENPSVSSQTGRIAFAARRGSDGVSDHLIYAMDRDGLNVHAVTTPSGLSPGESDTLPVISPDGSMIAFISKRFGANTTYPDGSTKNAEVYVVNFDGTGLHQVTASEQASNNNGTTAATAVAWSGGTLKVSARRGFTNDMGQRVTKTGIYSISPNGAGETLYLELGGLDFTDTIDATGGTILFTLNNVLFVGSGSDIHSYTTINTTTQALNARWGNGVRFSPDGSRIVYSSDDNNGSIVTIGSDGSSPVVVRSNLGGTGSGKWWFDAPPVPIPARLSLEPTALRVQNDGVTTRQVTPTLLDAGGNVIFHAADFSAPCGGNFVCTLNPNNFTYYPDGRIRVSNANNPPGHITFCGANGGLQTCTLVTVGEDLNFAEIRASIPSTNTNGAGGPGIFTVRRESTQSSGAFNVDFTLGGSAVRDLDYSLSVAGNSVIIPPGRTTVDIAVTPLRSAGNKTVSLNIAAQGGATYVTLPGRDAATVNIVDNGSPSATLSLSSISPASGGNGGVVLSSINGNNFAPGATVKLTRTGQADLPGANVQVASNGRSLTTVFDLNGKSPGQWSVVVTNPNTTTAQIVNGFSIEVNREARLTAQISGAETIRASHTRSRYDVVYTNHGNTDAFGVVLFISGVASHECADADDSNCTSIETSLASIPDIPGQDPFPTWVRQVPRVVPVDLPNVIGPGIRQVGAIPVLIPRIPANSSATFRFSMLFHSIDQSSLQRINVAIFPPLVTAVAVPGAAGFTIAMRPHTPDDANSDMNCIDSIFLNAINCAVGFIPGNACIGAGLGALQTVAQTAANISVKGTAAITPMSGAQFFAAGLSAMTCLESASPIGELLNVISCLAGFMDSCATCLGPDACNPFELHFVASHDPNEKAGVRRLTAENYVTKSNLLYGVSFENQPNATAPAQEVVVTDQLDTSKFDLSTFQLGQISFGDTVVDIPEGSKSFTTQVDLRPANDLLVDVSADLNQGTGLVTWRFNSIDPFTRQPPINALAGFLPANVIGTEGRGKVLFNIDPKSTLSSGTEIRNKATITFDLNSPIDTNEWLNTLDDAKPGSNVLPLAPTQLSKNFTVSWTGNDVHSGVSDYTLYASTNGGAFEPVISGTTATSTLFAGQVNSTYAFYVRARDNAGNVEDAPLVADAATLVVGVTAAGVEVSGRVLTSGGRGVRSAIVNITDQYGAVRSTVTGPRGTYAFADVEAGQTYIISVSSQRFQYAARVLQVSDNLAGIDFVPEMNKVTIRGTGF